MNYRNLECRYPNRLKELRVAKKLNQKEVAILIGFKAEDRICRWEKGQSMPSFHNIVKLAKFYEVKPEELYTGM